MADNNELDITMTEEETVNLPESGVSFSGLEMLEDARTATPEVKDNADIPAPPKAKAKKRKVQKADLTPVEDPASIQQPAAGEDTETADHAETEEPPAANPNFFQLNVRELDRSLTPEEQQSWNAIYASYRSRSILTDQVIGVDPIERKVVDEDTGETRRVQLYNLVLLHGTVRVNIPETELWAQGEEQPHYLAGALRDAILDYVVTFIDRPNELVIASRRQAMAKRRRIASLSREGRSPGDRTTCRLLAVGPKRVTAEVNGYDVVLSQRDLSYTAIADLRDEYHPGQELPAVIKAFEPRAGKIEISVKEAGRNPFIGAELRHPVGSRRKAIISGKYKGGVFCRLPDDTVCLCLYSNRHSDDEFALKDSVMVYITKYDYDRQLIYGRIISRW